MKHLIQEHYVILKIVMVLQCNVLTKHVSYHKMYILIFMFHLPAVYVYSAEMRITQNLDIKQYIEALKLYEYSEFENGENIHCHILTENDMNIQTKITLIELCGAMIR